MSVDGGVWLGWVVWCHARRQEGGAYAARLGVGVCMYGEGSVTISTELAEETQWRSDGG